MKAKEYLKKRRDICSSYQLSPEDKKFIKKQGIEAYIYKKLTLKKFRKWKLQEECGERTKKAINLCVSQNKPLKVVFPMGGYKLWRFPSSPEVDWAEFFNIAYVLEYLAPIASGYKKGVVLYYYMHTLLMEVHDNLTTKEINQYIDSFQKLLDFFGKHFPKNLKVKIWKDADIYSRKEYFQKLEEGYKKARDEYENWPKEKKERYFKMSELNIKWKGKESWEKLSKKQKKDKMVKSAIYESAAVYGLDKAIKKVKADEHVLVFCMSGPQFIGIGSCKNSIVKYWVGFGVLERKKNRFQGRILSPGQFEKVRKLKHEIEKINLISLRNFKEVWIYPKGFDFVHNK